MTAYVEIFEVGPRDGLQNEQCQISVVDEISLVNCLSRAGFRRIECASFVSPKRVPQMADSALVLDGIHRDPHVAYAALTPTMHGYRDAVQAGVDEIAVLGSASEGFSRANINATISESLDRFRPVVEAARLADIPVRGYVSCVIECPYEGRVSPDDVADVADRLFAMGCSEISLGDTIGRGTPESITQMLMAVAERIPTEKLAGHYHDTGRRALENIDASLDVGVRIFDTAIGGLGGCPFAPGSAGNVATERVVRHVESHGYVTGLDLLVIDEAAKQASGLRG